MLVVQKEVPIFNVFCIDFNMLDKESYDYEYPYHIQNLIDDGYIRIDNKKFFFKNETEFFQEIKENDFLLFDAENKKLHAVGKEDFKKMFKTIIPEEGWWL